ncbi:MAG: hypothetical protein OEX22_13290 [Cyclobacteriaceae bacterium]|nr:hypothetical protein [Cyclobacteriaceae bacterium]
MIATIEKTKVKKGTNQKQKLSSYADSLLRSTMERELKKEKAIAEIRKALIEKPFYWSK